MRLVEIAKKLLAILEAEGFEAYMVGGCVRDMLLGREVHDVDICTSATPDEVCALFPQAIPTGLKHGTVTVVEEGTPFEITTFRQETGYSDFRRPDRVQFVKSLREDLSRRDFTINAMALDRNGQLYDYFGGERDLKQKLIRTVGPPHARFGEDALRMLRAVRFAGQLGFYLTEDVFEAIGRLAHRLTKVAVERITQEFCRLMRAPHVEHGLIILGESGIPPVVPPFHHLETRLKRIAGYSLKELNERERWAFLLAPLSSKEQHAFLQGLRLPKAFAGEIIRLLKALAQHRGVVELSMITPYELFILGREDSLSVLKINQLFTCKLISPHLKQQLEEKWQQLPLHHPKELSLTGKDLQKILNKPPGPWIKETLNRLIKLVIQGDLPNERTALKAFLVEDKHGE